MKTCLEEVFVLETRKDTRGKWKTESIYDPFGALSHDFKWVSKTAKTGKIIKGLLTKTEYRVVRFVRCT